MKKLLLSVVIATMTLSLTGCVTKSNSELDEVNKKLADTYETMSKLEEKVSELSDKLNKQADELDNRIYNFDNLELDYYNKNDGVVEIRVSYLKDDYQKSYEEYIENLKSQGKNVIAPEEIYGETLFTIETTSTLTNVTYSDVCDDFMNVCGMDINKSIMNHGLSNNGNLAKELKPGEILVFAAHESEGIPTSYFYWTEESGKIVYNAITFDGSGERYTYN